MEQQFKVGALKFTLAQLKHWLRYDPRTGIWTWRNPRTNGVKKGSRAGGNSHGYIRIKIDHEQYAAHRLAWFYMTGEWPNKRIDHKNNDPGDNRWRNLRLTDHGPNLANGKLRSNNSLGLKGVTRAYKNRFTAQIQCEGKHINLGYFKSAQKAHKAYVAKAKELFGEFARAR